MEISHEKELEVAQRVQEHTHPRNTPKLPGYLVFAKTIPATWGNGDFYDIIGVKPRNGKAGYVLDRDHEVNHLVLSMGDATGHGMGAALMATEFTAMMRMSIRLGVYYRDLVNALNAQLLEDLPEGHFITLLMGRLDRERHMFRWVSFGQGPIWLYRAATDEVEVLAAHHPPLGVLEAMLDYKPTETLLETGDTILSVSDGFHETSNRDEELIGQQELMESFRSVAKDDPEKIFQMLWNKLHDHANGATQADDRTFLLIRREH